MSDEKISVIIVTDGVFPLSVGGMQRHSRLLAEALADTGKLHLTVVHPHGSEKLFMNHPSINEVGIVTGNDRAGMLAGLKGFGYLVKAYSYSKKVFDELQKHPDAIVYSQGLAVWYGIRRLRQPVVINPHGLEPYQALTVIEKLKTWPLRMVHNFLFRHASRIVSLGGRLTPILAARRGVGIDKVVVIPNAVNPPAGLPVRSHDPGRVSLLFVGRFAFNKGIPALLSAIKQLNAEGYGDSMSFTLAGKGPLYEQSVRNCREENVVFAGQVDDHELQRLYRSCSLFVLPTLFEGMPTVVLEAMSAGMPVMVTDTGGTRELVDDSNGYIIAKNDPASIKSAAIQFLNLPPAKRQLMSEASVKKVKERFTWQAVALGHLHLFRKMSRAHG